MNLLVIFGAGDVLLDELHNLVLLLHEILHFFALSKHLQQALQEG